MKKKILKIGAAVLAVLLIVGVAWFANSLVGNPLSKALAKSTAEKHMKETYGNTDYELGEVVYSFKDGYYHAHVSSPSSIDTNFELLINGFGKLPPNISEADREEWSRKALAISNNAMAINKKALGLFHPHESSEAHAELIQATESLRLAAYSLYTYTLQENAADQKAQLQQAKEQLGQSKIFLDRFIAAIQGLLTNYKEQPEEN